jgi:WD40 repeat protein
LHHILRRAPTFSPDRKVLALVVAEQPTKAEMAAFLEEVAKEPLTRGSGFAMTCTAIQLRDRKTGKLLRQFGKSFEGGHQLAFSADGKTLAEGRHDGVVALWDTATGNPIRRLGKKQPAQAIYHLAFSPDGKTLVAWHHHLFRTWDTATGKLLCEFGKDLGFLGCLAFTPDGKAVVTGSRDEPICFWDPRTGKRLRELTWHRGAVNALVFSPDGKTLASAGEDQTVRLWEVATDRERLRFTGHRGSVSALAFSPDGRRLASGSSDTTALVWDVSGAGR